MVDMTRDAQKAKEFDDAWMNCRCRELDAIAKVMFRAGLAAGRSIEREVMCELIDEWAEHSTHSVSVRSALQMMATIFWSARRPPEQFPATEGAMT